MDIWMTHVCVNHKRRRITDGGHFSNEFVGHKSQTYCIPKLEATETLTVHLRARSELHFTFSKSMKL